MTLDAGRRRAYIAGMDFPIERLAEFRTAAGRSRAWVADKIKVSERTILRWEQGVYRPRQRDLDALGVLFPQGANGAQSNRGSRQQSTR